MVVKINTPTAYTMGCCGNRSTKIRWNTMVVDSAVEKEPGQCTSHTIFIAD